jgi:hypothetical protein
MPNRSISRLIGILLLTVLPVGASMVLFDQGEFNQSADFRNSNTPTNGNPVTGTGSTQQIADDFTVTVPGLRVTQVDLWFAYQFGTPSPLSQPLILRIWDDVAGGPGSIVYEALASFAPIATGDFNSLSRQVFRGEVLLETPFLPDPNVRYWLSPLGSDDSVTWGWQFSNPTSGERRSRFGNDTDWRSASATAGPFTGDFAFALIGTPEPASLALLVVGAGLFGLRRSRR